jgi:hypothetical protein
VYEHVARDQRAPAERDPRFEAGGTDE